jgi:hypothetical protein
MKNLILAGVVGVAIGVLIMLWHPFYSDFTESDIRQCEQTIKETYANRFRNSPSETERQEVENGAITFDVQMIKVGERKLEGYMKISINTPSAKELGVNEISYRCEATMETTSSHYIWECNPIATR